MKDLTLAQLQLIRGQKWLKAKLRTYARCRFIYAINHEKRTWVRFSKRALAWALKYCDTNPSAVLSDSHPRSYRGVDR